MMKTILRIILFASSVTCVYVSDYKKALKARPSKVMNDFRGMSNEDLEKIVNANIRAIELHQKEGEDDSVNLQNIEKILLANPDFTLDPEIFHEAVRLKNIQLVDLILRSRPHVNFHTPLSYEFNFDVNNEFISDEQRLFYKAYPVHIASFNGDIQMLNYLISRGASCNVLNGGLQTPLHLAVMKNNFDITQRLLAENAIDITQKDKHGLSTFHYGSVHLDNKILKLLVADLKNNPRYKDMHIADMAIDSEMPLLVFALVSGNIELFKMLVQANSNVNHIFESVDPDGKQHFGTILHVLLAGAEEIHISDSDRIEMVKLLLQAGADLTIKDQDGKVSADYVKNSSSELAQLLQNRQQEIKY